MNFEVFKSKYELQPVIEVPNQVNQNPKLTVLVLTYQQAPYIKECLDGILMQKTNFSIEIIIGEDDSSDGTRKICKEYAEKNPDKIRLMLHSRVNNIKINNRPSPLFNLFYSTFSSRGNYVAICEGDDFWTDPQKLQKQVDFMEANPNCVLCYHPTECVDEKDPLYNHIKHPPNPEKSQLFNIKDYILGKGLGIWTVSVVAKSKSLKTLPNWLFKAPLTDLALKLYYAYNGEIGYIPGTMAGYRRRTIGSWSEFSKTYEWQLNHMESRICTYNLFNSFSEYKYNKEIKSTNKWWKQNCLPEAYGYANRTERRKLLFNNLDFFLNFRYKGNFSRWLRLLFGDHLITILKGSYKKII